MKKQMYGIIGLGAAVAVLGAGLAVLKATDKSGDDTSSSAVDMQETTVEGADLVLVEDGDKAPGSHTLDEGHTHGQVDSVKVVNSLCTLDVKVKTPATDSSSAVYTLDGYEDLPLMESVVGTLVNNADNLTSASLIEENCTDFDKFGLADGAVTVDIKYHSGTERKLYIGDVSPVSNQTYVRVDGSSNVYTVVNSKMANYLKKTEDFVSLTMLDKPEDDAYPKVDSLRIERDDIDYDIYIEYGKNSDEKNSGGSAATHVLAEPTSAMLTVENSTPIVTGMFGLIADSVKYLRPGEKELAETGLDKPFCIATMKYEGKEQVLYMSEPFKDEDGTKKAYAMFKDSKVLYVVTTENAKWATVMPIDIISRMMLPSYVWNISEFTASGGDITEKFEISMKDSSTKTNEAKTEDVIVKRNGKEFDAERYRLFYAFLINCHAEELALGEPVPDEKPMASIKYKDVYLDQEYTYEFYDYSVMKSLVVINGESKFFCSKKNAQSLVDNIGRIGTMAAYADAT